MVQNFNKAFVIDHFILLFYKERSENSNVFVLLSSEVIARMKPGVDGGVFIAIEVGEDVRTF